MLSLDSSVVVAPGCLAAGVSGETVLLSLDDGVYYGLDAIGTRVWALLQERRRVREIRDDILAAYDVTSERCEADLLALLDDMQAHRLIQVSEGDGSEQPAS